MMHRCHAMVKLLVLGFLVTVHQVNAQGVRDPTVPPAVAGLGAAPMEGRMPEPGPDAFGFIVRDGQPFLVQGSRLYRQGQQIGQMRIERITETAVWLREDGVLRKQPLFPGVQLRILPLKTLPFGSPSGASSAPLNTISPSTACALMHSHCSSQEIEKSAP